MQTLSADVVITGAGPAGCTCALHLEDSGLKVILLDKNIFPRDKICGDALSGTVPFELARLKPEIRSAFLDFAGKLPTRGIRFVAPRGKHLDLLLHNSREGYDAPGYISERLHFDNFLFQQVRSGGKITVLENCEVKSASFANGHSVQLESTQGTIHAQMVIAADGAHSVLAKALGHTVQKEHYSAGLRQYYENVTGFTKGNLIELHFYSQVLPGYFWIFPLPGNRANVGIGMRSDIVSRRKINLKQEMEKIIREHPLVAPRFAEARAVEKPQGFGLPLGSLRRKISSHRCLLTGDAASLIDPFSGEGIGNAMTSGRLAAQHAVRCFAAADFSEAFNREYDDAIYRKLGAELSTSYTLQKLLKYPRLFDFVVGRANRNPHLHRFIEKMLSDVSQRKELTRPSFYYRLLFNPAMKEGITNYK